MPNHLVPGFVTKKTAAKRCNRSVRQISRDLASAMASRDAGLLEQHELTVEVNGTGRTIRGIELLANAKLRTEDGTIREGTRVTTAEVKELRDQGKNPTWYFKPSWMKEHFGERPSSVGDASDDLPPVAHNSATPSGADIVQLLKEQIADLKEDKRKLAEDHQKELALIRDVFEAFKDEVTTTKDLVKEVLKKLPEGRANSDAAPSLLPSNLTADVIETEPQTTAEKGRRSTQTTKKKAGKRTRKRKPPKKPTRRDRIRAVLNRDVGSVFSRRRR